MVKCLECGFESTRLQWTHFKFNCTGKFKNGKEYMLAYPGAKVVDPYLAKSTAITLENLTKKYGAIDGNQRWQEYRSKQAHSNSYEYKKEKFGWSKEQFKEYNSSRSQTLEKMILRHGETEGIAKWELYCARQAYTNTKNYFIEKYGLDKGTGKYIAINKKKSVNSPALLSEKLNISLDQATEIILSRQKQFFTSNLEQEFISAIEQQIGTLDNTTKNKPFGKWSSLLNTYVIYDIRHKKCIIEFNGDYWHANPNIYKDDTIIRGKKAVDIRHKDMLKLKTVQDLGYKTLVVWESDFKNHKDSTIKQVCEWILREQK
jgi:hypothetical protein